jgi:Metallo-peptidase family M12B Reprolysin-like
MSNFNLKIVFSSLFIGLFVFGNFHAYGENVNQSNLFGNLNFLALPRLGGANEAKVKHDVFLSGTLKKVIKENNDLNEDGHEIYYLIHSEKFGFINVAPFKGIEENINAEIEVSGNWSTKNKSRFAVTELLSSKAEYLPSVVRSEIETLNAQGEVTDAISIAPQPTTGVRKLVVIPIAFSDSSGGAPVTSTQLKNILYNDANSINNQYNNMSKGKLQLGGVQDVNSIDVSPLIVLPHNSTDCSFANVSGPWTNEAIDGFQALGNNIFDYRIAVILYSGDNPNCSGWGGAGTLGPLGSTTSTNLIWIKWQTGPNISFLRDMLTHELGHNLGLHHSSSVYQCSSNQNLIPNGCTTIEYGDPFSVMGGTPTRIRSFSNIDLNKLGWINGKVAKLQEPGVYNLYLSSPSLITKNNQLVTFPLKDSNGVLTGQSAYLEFRKNFLPYEDFNSDLLQTATKGATLRIAPTDLGVQINSYLIDNNPLTIATEDAPISVGQTYTNTTWGFTVRANSIIAQRGLNLTVTLTR